MTITLLLTIEPPVPALDDRDPMAWTAGYVAGSLRAAGVIVHEARLALDTHTDDHEQVGDDPGPGVRSALAMAVAEMDQPPPATGDGLTIHEMIVETAQRERRFDPDAARARAAAASTTETLGFGFK